MTLANRTRKPSYAEVAKSPTRNVAVTPTSEKSNIKVVVRVRPENQTEKSGNYGIVVRVMNENVLVFDPREQGSPQYGYYNRVRRRDIGKRQRKDLKFAFDCVFGPDSKNSEVYKQTTKHILNGLLDGYNCSVFAYGATGAGKTHTMLGNPQQPGVMYLTMLDLYNRINSIQDEKKCDVAVSYLEVYNEQIHDLLVPGKSLPVREDAHCGVVIPGLSLHKPNNADELLHMLQFGNQKRTQHPTDANAESSRSHAVFQVFVRQKDRTANISTEVRVAKLCLVDLAGSERATVTKNRGTRFREGANINRSLLALGNCINALADSKYKGHVPYRDSKLTRLLKDSLGGNCQTVMIAAVSPSSMTYEDTYNALKYADRAKHIQATLKKNVLNVDFHVARYSQIVVELRAEIEELKGKLQLSEEHRLPSRSIAEVCQFREKLDGIYYKRLNFTREYLDADLKSRDLKWKIVRKEKCLSRLEVADSNQGSRIKERLKKTILSAKSQIDGFERAKSECVEKLNENRKHLDKFMSNCREQDEGAGDQERNQELVLHEEVHQAKLDLTESEYHVKHLTKVVRYQERELQASEKLVLCLLSLVRKQYTVMKGQQLLTSDLNDHYSNIQTLVEGREVTFADQSMSSHSASYDLGQLLDFKSLIQGVQGIHHNSNNKNNTHTETGTLKSEAVNSIHGSDKSTVGVHPLQSHMGGSDAITHNSLDHPCEKCKMYACMCNKSQAEEQPCPNCRMFSCMCSQKSHNLKSGSNCAGHTPFTKRYSHSKDVDNSAIFNGSEGANSRVQNADSQCIQNSSSHVQGQVLNPPSVRVLTPSASSYSKKQVVDDKALDSLESSHDLNSTFTLDEPQKPEVRARTPVIVDKFSHPSGSNGSEAKSMGVIGSTQLPCTGQNNGSKKILQIQNNSTNDEGKNTELPFRQCNTVTKAYPSVSLPMSSEYNGMEESDLGELESKENNVVSLPHSGTVTKKVPTVLTSVSENRMIEGGLQQSEALKASSSGSNPVTMTSNASSCQLDDTYSAKSIESSTDSQHDSLTGKSHVVRAIQFDTGNQSTPPKARTWAEVVKTPPSVSPVKRLPLSQVNGNSTPLAMPLSPGNKNSLNIQPFGKCNSSSTPRLSYPFRNVWDESAKENTKMLQQLGLPSLVDKSSITPTRKGSVKRPNYMQMTKAAKQRTSKQGPRIFKRSQSTTSIGRPGWQI